MYLSFEIFYNFNCKILVSSYLSILYDKYIYFSKMCKNYKNNVKNNIKYQLLLRHRAKIIS